MQLTQCQEKHLGAAYIVCESEQRGFLFQYTVVTEGHVFPWVPLYRLRRVIKVDALPMHLLLYSPTNDNCNHTATPATLAGFTYIALYTEPVR